MGWGDVFTVSLPDKTGVFWDAILSRIWRGGEDPARFNTQSSALACASRPLAPGAS